MEEKTSCKNKKVLIVEDEKPARMALAKKLEKHGFEVIESQNGKEGLEVVKNKTPDIILLDVKMPVMGGVEVLDTLKKDDKLSMIPVIVLTNDSTTETMASVLSAGGTHYFVKADTSLEKIVNKVKLMLNCE